MPVPPFSTTVSSIDTTCFAVASLTTRRTCVGLILEQHHAVGVDDLRDQVRLHQHAVVGERAVRRGDLQRGGAQALAEALGDERDLRQGKSCPLPSPGRPRP